MQQKNRMCGTDQILINIQDSSELTYWAVKFGVSKDEIKTAVKAAGGSLTAVQNKLKELHRT
ncbi:DUF3606 domain-containing protein [Pseudomonas sp. MAFF 302030]|uniref:DUF3606 domain-containing protein n=1 Tax=Pseudomonas morbosilactucae TaxID=2938197 RepID=A0A9X1Z1P8_9PSED|nr:DUF3606 domain-containing protein [Pseudomonas morbosilactucae]MCK9802155.1 DUF3606 domain-containing protein [Pseudomonas morbosilactucae]